MSQCKECSGRGWVETTRIKSAMIYNHLIMCPVCKDLKGYSKEIKLRYGNQDETPQEKVNRLIGRD